MEVIGFTGKIHFDLTKPDGTPRKCLDVGRMQNLEWFAKTGLRQGIIQAYQDFLANQKIRLGDAALV